MTHAEQLKQKLQQLDYFDDREFIGCTEAEIEELEALHPQSIRLPEAYKDFLRVGGKTFTDLRPMEVFYWHHLKLGWGEGGLFTDFFDPERFRSHFFPDNTNIIFPENGFPFMAHMGYQCRFFICDGKDEDPLVYYFDDSPKLTYYKDTGIRYSELITSYVDGFIDQHQEKLQDHPRLQKPYNEFKRMLFEMMDLSEGLKAYEGDLEYIDRAIDYYREAYRDSYNLYSTVLPMVSEINSKLSVYLYPEVVKESPEVKRVLLEFQEKGAALKKFYNDEVLTKRTLPSL
jgi:hypothetical protein